MRSFGKQVHDGLVSFVQQVVYNRLTRSNSEALVKDDSKISGKNLLVLSVTVHYLARRRISHFRHMVDKSKYAHGLAARRRSGDDGRKQTFKRQHLL